MSYAKLLEIKFQGFFLCRLATDPDPSNERRGVSGYTMALATEDPLDQVIRTQVDHDFEARHLREPAKQMGLRVGVDVYDVAYDGKGSQHARERLLGAKLCLEGKNLPFNGPTFDSRNNIVGSDDTNSFVVNPFELAIYGKGVSVRARDYLNPADPGQKIWQIADPALYQRRLGSAASSSTEVMAAIQVFDQYAYFRDRRRFLADRIKRLEHELAQVEAAAEDPTAAARLAARIEGMRSRIYQLELWGDRVIDQLSNQITYSFSINGPQEVLGKELLKGEVDEAHPWPITFWFGGWDGDLLVGYLQGTLGIPFQPTRLG
jgi:hypothetical protein